MRGRWAAGIVPRHFCWILKDQLAVSERPGGFAPHHRRVRRQEEIFWLNAQGFTRIVSLLPSNHNLHAYDELHVVSSHFALPAHGDARPVLDELYRSLWTWLRDGERVLLHQEELSEQVAGVVAGFLCWSGLLAEPPRATSVVEQLLRRQMGAAGRSIVAVAAELAPMASTGTGLRPAPDQHGGSSATSVGETPPPLAPAPATSAPRKVASAKTAPATANLAPTTPIRPRAVGSPPAASKPEATKASSGTTASEGGEPTGARAAKASPHGARNAVPAPDHESSPATVAQPAGRAGAKAPGASRAKATSTSEAPAGEKIKPARSRAKRNDPT